MLILSVFPTTLLTTGAGDERRLHAVWELGYGLQWSYTSSLFLHLTFQ